MFELYLSLFPGIGDYASWFLGAVIIRDVQTGKKYQFANDRWLAVEYKDGEVDRTIPVVEGELPLRRRFYQTRENNLKQNHLWISIFSRSPRSRYTRCQRVTAATVSLFLSMLVNAMWFGVFSRPSVPGIDVFGLVTISWEEVSMAFLVNVVTFPFVYLITFLFKYSKPSKLRSNTIKKSLETKEENEKHSDNEDGDDDDSDHDSVGDDDDNRVDDDAVKDDAADTKSLVSVGMNWFIIIISFSSYQSRFHFNSLFYLDDAIFGKLCD